MLTRREALQGIAGVTAAALLPSVSAQVGKKVEVGSWPEHARTLDSAFAFNDDWRFHRGDFPGAEAPDFNDSGWRMLDVPHDWSIEDLPPSDSGKGAVWAAGNTPIHVGPFDMYVSEGQTATGWTVGGIGWYRKTFDRPTVVPGGKSEIHFEGVYRNSDVWLNGVKLGSHPYGYTEFAFDITPHLKDGRNTVAVRVDNTGRNSRWYSGSGIYRKVWLDVAGELRIPAHGVFVTTPEATRDAALVNLEVTVESGAKTAKRTTVLARLVDATGAVAGEGQALVTSHPGGRSTVSCAVRLTSPHLWSPADPYLYRAEVAIEADRRTAAATNVQIGIRTVEIDAARGLRINGESLKLRGGCVHHDNGPLGSASIPRADERRVETLKASGYNAIRTSHNPPSRDFLEACDRHGMLVVDEAFDGWVVAKNPEDYHLYFKEWSRRDLEGMILRDRNHPSVILWSIGNETNERAEPQGIEIGKALASYAHALDPTRKVTAAICGPYDHPKQTWQDMQPAFSYLDVGGYNYELADYENDHAKFPERVIMGTESYPNQVVQNWRAIEKDPWVIGDFVWTAMDYIGEAGVGHTALGGARGGPGGSGGGLSAYPWFISFCGDIDLIGNKKPQSYLRDVVWRRSSIEMAVQRPIPPRFTERISPWGWSDELRSWTWPGFEGTPLKVRVYSRAAHVKLLLNGKEIGAKDMKEEDALKAEFTVPYSPGELKAVAYEGDREIGSIPFLTAGSAKKLKLTADRTKLKSSRDDLSYIMATVVDDQGRLVPDAVLPVSFTLSGVGEIAAVGNANPKDVASFRQQRRDTFQGTCVAIVRPTLKSGTITLNAESPGLESATLRLNAVG
ncbi:MAG: glycoside hydrolase family 2 protein [Acidobacteria bacterium]|nr:glycoside hydrolase family 2 protein [Acidobacteriota bacterium]MBW4046206.1 glycoside hydrolase family 2 protein [Acidobacteriota bacterium]